MSGAGFRLGEREQLPRRGWLRHGGPCAFLIGAVILVSVALGASLGTRVFSELAYLKQAPRDNIQWAASQLETEAIRMHLAALDVRQGRVSDLGEFRKRFDIFYSRVDVVRSGSMFEPLLGHPVAEASLEALWRFVEAAVPAVDGPDAALRARLAEVVAQGPALQSAARDLALVAVDRFAERSDHRRAAFADLLRLTSTAGLAVIALLLGTAAVLLWQVRLTRRREAEVRRSEGRLAAMVNSALDAVVVTDARGRIIEYNPSAETIFGFSRAEAVGWPMHELIVPPRYREAHRAGFQRHLDTGEASIVGKGRVELSALNAGGEAFPVELAIGRSMGEDGPIFIAYLRDITQRKNAESALREARIRAERADQAKSDFLAVMSHEMRTPFHGVLGAIDLLRTTPLDARQARYVALAEKSGEMLQCHISDVLDISKIEAGKLEIEPEAFDPARLVHDLAEVTAEEALKRDNQITVEVDPRVPGRVIGDAHRLRQVLLNLLSNAIKFTSEGTITITLRRIAGDAAAPTIEFAVRDTGIGIAEADVAKLFDDFVVLDPSYSREVGGTGLGLAICQRIVTAMGGEIGVESEPGAGSRFWFRLSLPVAQAVPAGATPVSCGRRPAGRGTILLAEDNRTNRVIAEAMLSNAGYQVVTAEDGAEAVHLAAETAFDLILMDVSMPRMDGLAATKRIRQGTGASRNATIIGVTAHVLPAEIDRFVGAGMQACLTKPLRLNDLLGLLGAVADAGTVESGLAGPGSGVPAAAGIHSDSDQVLLLDLGEIERLRLELRPDFLHRMLRQFCEELDQARRRLNEALEARDLPRLKREAHALHGAAASVGAARLAAEMANLELACDAGCVDRANDKLLILDDIASETNTRVQELIPKLNATASTIK